MKILLKIALTAIAVVIIAHFLPGVTVDNAFSAIKVALLLGLLRITVRPILVILTLPVTILTLGLFLFVINAIMILLASNVIGGFTVAGFWVALLFSLLLSVTQSVLYKFLKKE